jgi:broad specificity phosphatase PhoE
LPLVLIVAAIACQFAAQAQDGVVKESKYPRHILIIRHAEKTGEKGDIHLSKKGVERAAALHQLFEKTKERPDPFPVPEFIFAASNSTSSERPRETVAPLAKRLKLSIDHAYLSNRTGEKLKGSDRPQLGDEILRTPKYARKTILISWRHGAIPELAALLGAKDAPTKWDDHCFDRVWQITFDERGQASLRDRPQRLFPTDSPE